MSIPALPDLAEATTAVLEEAGLPELDPMTAVDPSNALPAVPAQTTAAEPVTGGAVAAPPPEPAAETPVQAASTPDSDAGRASVCPGRGADGADEYQRLRAGGQPRRQRLGRADERRRSGGCGGGCRDRLSVSAGFAAVSGADTGRGDADGRCGAADASRRARRGRRRLDVELGVELWRCDAGYPDPAGGRDAELDLELGLELRRTGFNTGKYIRGKTTAVSTRCYAVSADQYQHLDPNQQPRQRRGRLAVERRRRPGGARRSRS